MKKNNSDENLKLFVKNLVLFIFVVITALVVVPVVLVWLAADFLAFSIYDFKFAGLIVEAAFKAPLQKHGFKETAPGAYDLRDWDEIRKWTKELAKTARE